MGSMMTKVLDRPAFHRALKAKGMRNERELGESLQLARAEVVKLHEGIAPQEDTQQRIAEALGLTVEVLWVSLHGPRRGPARAPRGWFSASRRRRRLRVGRI
jgi:hypothetical protein